MATSLTKQNLVDIFAKLLIQYNAVKVAQDAKYTQLKGYNIDFFSHFSQKIDASTSSSDLLTSFNEFQNTVTDLATTYSEFSRYSCYANLFSAIDTYCRQEPSLTDKTLNGFLTYNGIKVSDTFNKLYYGILGKYLQARNVLPPLDMVIYGVRVINLSLVNDTTVTPDSSVFNNSSYVTTTADGKTYAPFPIKMVPNAETSGIKLLITFSDNTTQTVDALLTENKIPASGINLSAWHSGVKSVTVVSRTMSDEDFANFTLTFSANYNYMTFSSPTGWDSPSEEAIQLYVGTDTTGTRIYFKNYYVIEKGESISLYMRINPSLLGDIEGKWVVNGTTLDYGTVEGNWYVNSQVVIPSDGFTVTATALDIPTPIAYMFTDAIDNSFQNPLNYIPNGTPTSIDTVTVSNNIYAYPTGELTCSKLIYYNGFFSNVTLDGDLELRENAGMQDGWVTGTAHFYDATTNYSTLGYPVVFHNTSTNYGQINNTASFIDSSVNQGTITNVSGIGNFYDNSVNNGNIAPTVGFYDSSSCVGGSSLGDGVTFYENSSLVGGAITAPIFKGYSSCKCSIDSASFYEHSKLDSSGYVYTATFWPLNTGTEVTPVWVYPTNEGSIETANIHWLQADNDLGGTVTTENYLGYP